MPPRWRPQATTRVPMRAPPTRARSYRRASARPPRPPRPRPPAAAPGSCRAARRPATRSACWAAPRFAPTWAGSTTRTPSAATPLGSALTTSLTLTLPYPTLRPAAVRCTGGRRLLPQPGMAFADEVFCAAPAAYQRSSLGRCGAAPGTRAAGREAGACAHACPCAAGTGPAVEVACSGFAAVHAS